MTLQRDSSGLRLNLCKMWMMRNFVVCVLCQNLLLKHCQRLNPSAPGKMELVYPRSSGDVVVQWAAVHMTFALFFFFSLLTLQAIYAKKKKILKYSSNKFSKVETV